MWDEKTRDTFLIYIPMKSVNDGDALAVATTCMSTIPPHEGYQIVKGAAIHDIHAASPLIHIPKNIHAFWLTPSSTLTCGQSTMYVDHCS